MRSVLQITPSYVPNLGGLEDVVRSLSAAMVGAGWKCDIAEVATSHWTLSSEQIDLSTVFRVPLYGDRLIGIAPALGRLVTSYDLIHVHDPQVMALTANAFFWRAGKPLVLSTHGGFFHTDHYSFIKPFHARFTARMLLSVYDAILASSEADRKMFATMSGRVELVQNGVTVSKFENIARSLPYSFMRWIYWGRFSENKRINKIIDYASAARKRGFNVNLTICGGDFDGIEPSLRKIIRDSDLAAYVKIMGSPSDEELADLIRQSSAFITASQFEGFGLSVIEAMAAGMPIICTDIAPLNAFVKPGLNGVLLSFDQSQDDLDRLIGFLSQSEDSYREISLRNRQTAQAYSWRKAQRAFEAVYRRLVMDQRI